METFLAVPPGNDRFKFHLPFSATLEKAGADRKAIWKIRGYASTGAKDRQGETVVQNGLNFDPFIQHGWFNYDHNNEEILGYPDKTTTKMTPKGLYVEGTLLQSNPIAGKLWHLAQELKTTNSPRQLGMSVEGKVKQRDANGHIIKADVYNVALTPNPVNPEATFEAFAKSFAGNESAFDVYGQPTTGEQPGDQLDFPQYNNDPGFMPSDRVYSAFAAIAEIVSYEDGRAYLRERLKMNGMGLEEAVLYLQIVTGASRADALQQVAGMITTS